LNPKLCELENGNSDRKWFKRSYFLLSILILPALIITALHALSKSNFFNISKIDLVLTGEDLDRDLLRKDIVNLEGQIRNLSGLNLWQVDVDQIGRDLLKTPWINRFTVVKSWPNFLQIEIEMSPIIFFKKTKSHFEVFFGTHKFRRFGHEKDGLLTSRFPELVTYNEAINDEVIAHTYHVISLLKDKKYLSNNNIQTITLDSNKGYRIQLRDPNTEVLLGFVDEPDRLERVTRVIEYLKEHKIEARVIDSNFTKKVLVRLRNQL